MAIGSRKSGKGPIKQRIQWVRGLAFHGLSGDFGFLQRGWLRTRSLGLGAKWPLVLKWPKGSREAGSFLSSHNKMRPRPEC